MGRLSTDGGCGVIVFGGLMLDAVFTDPREEVVMVSQTVVFIVVCGCIVANEVMLVVVGA